MTSHERVIELGGVSTVVTDRPEATANVVLLHGYDMTPADLSPFAHSLGLPVRFLLPTGPMTTPSGRRAWWDVDLEARSRALQQGGRDLFTEHPPGVPAARQLLSEVLKHTALEFPVSRTLLGGFSQGGMLATDFLLHERAAVDALILMSSSRICFDNWTRLQSRLSGLPVFTSHGRSDPDLAFGAGEGLRDFAVTAGADVTWIAFDGGHEIPLVVWRALRKFLGAVLS